jgi:hypothetical protein
MCESRRATRSTPTRMTKEFFTGKWFTLRNQGVWKWQGIG